MEGNMKDIYKRTTTAIIAATAVAATFTSCGNSEKQILKYIEKGEYDSAVDAYNSNNLNDKQYPSLIDGLSEKIENSITDYANNTTDYNTVMELISAVYKMRISDMDQVLVNCSAKLATLKASKDAFENGNSAMANNDYLTAYQCFKSVYQDDINYNDAVSSSNTALINYKNSVMENAAAYEKENMYDDAIAYLENSRSTIDSEEFISAVDDKITDLEVKKSEYELQQINSHADELVESGSYDEAIDYLNSEKNNTNSEIVSLEVSKKISAVRKTAVVKTASKLKKDGNYEEALGTIKEYTDEYGSEDSEVSQLQSEISNEYVALITEKVTALCNEENYIKALTMLENAQQVVNADEFHAMSDKINEIKPTYLYDLKISESSRYEVIDSGDKLKDTLGNEYDVGNLFQISTTCDGWNIDNGSASYYLGYKYSRIHGIAAVNDISDNTYGKLTFYGDDSVLYSVDLNRTTAAVPIDLDISNVNWLKIELTYEHDNGTLYTILSDFVVEK